MTNDVEQAAIKLPFSMGEFRCTWNVRVAEGTANEISGLLTLEPNQYPSGVLYGEMPIKWETDGEGSQSASFPQRHQFECLTGRLSTGTHVALMGGEISYWFETQGRAVGAFAILSQDEFDAESARAYSSIELQIEGLEAVVGVGPISQTIQPRSKDAEPTWAATVNRDAKTDWVNGDYSMSFSYAGSFRSFDAYEFRMVFGPVLRLTSARPLTATEWWLGWVNPLRQLMSVITGAPPEIRYLCAQTDNATPMTSQDQIFGWGIAQRPVNSSRRAVEQIRSTINVTKDDLSLLDLLVKWQNLSAARHPVIETFGSMATATDQHPRSRFLLLLQAIEGLHGFENTAAHQESQSRYEKKRTALLQRAAEVVSTTDLRFLEKYVMRNAAQGLEQSLIAVFSSLHIDIRNELDQSALAAEIRTVSAKPKLRSEAALVRARNWLSHGTSNLAPEILEETAHILDRVVRSELLRVLGAPMAARERALAKPERF